MRLEKSNLSVHGMVRCNLTSLLVTQTVTVFFCSHFLLLFQLFPQYSLLSPFCSFKCIRQSLEDSNRCPKCNYTVDNVDQLYPNFLGKYYDSEDGELFNI